MNLMKSASRFLKKNGGTILAIGASVGVVLTAIETGKASIKAEKLIEMNSAEPTYTTKEKVKDCWKFYLPAAALGAGTIACILGSNALNKKQIASLTAGYMALGKAYQEYRREVAQHVGADYEKEIYKDAQSVLKKSTSDMVEDKLLCYEPISKRYFHATEAALLEAFYSLNRDFALNGSKRLPYVLEPGNIDAYDELMQTLYSPDEREKIEWCIGSIVNGDSKTIQKFMVLYGPPGSGKSTVLNIIQKLFTGYYAASVRSSSTPQQQSFCGRMALRLW